MRSLILRRSSSAITASRWSTPALGRILLCKLQPLHTQDVCSEKLARGRKDGSGELSAHTVVHMHRFLRTALGQAVKWQILARNPANVVEPPKVARREMVALTNAETAKLFSSLARSTPRPDRGPDRASAR